MVPSRAREHVCRFSKLIRMEVARSPIRFDLSTEGRDGVCLCTASLPRHRLCISHGTVVSYSFFAAFGSRSWLSTDCVFMSPSTAPLFRSVQHRSCAFSTMFGFMSDVRAIPTATSLSRQRHSPGSRTLVSP